MTLESDIKISEEIIRVETKREMTPPMEPGDYKLGENNRHIVTVESNGSWADRITCTNPRRCEPTPDIPLFIVSPVAIDEEVAA